MANIAVCDAADFDEFAIVDSETPDIMVESVDLNSDAEPANVSGFDIAGIMLGMSYDDVHNLFFDIRGLYTPRKKNAVIYTIHQDWKYNLDYECRQQGTVIPQELQKCVNSLAKARGLMYASEIHLERENTGETIVVYLTSNATDNRVWRVVYNNDVNEKEGKRTGAYSSSVPNLHPFILLNYSNTLDDVFTVAHEAGHSIHSMYSSEAQPTVLQNYTIFVAEIASTFNEHVLLDYFMNKPSTTKEEKIGLLQKAIDEIYATFYRQTLFANYELEAHKLVENNQPINYQVLCGIMEKLYKQYIELHIQ